MSSKNREDSTEQLIAEGEALRSASRPKKAPATRQLVRDAERLIGRAPVRSGVKPLLRWALVFALIGLVIAALFFLFA